MVVDSDIPGLIRIPVSEIAFNPENPREKLSSETLKESIEQKGLKNPIKVRPIGSEDLNIPDDCNWIVVDGDNRLKALKEINSHQKLKIGKEIIISDITREEAFDDNVILNMQQKEYTLREECKIVEHLIEERQLTYKQIRQLTGKSDGWIGDRVQILKLPPIEREEYYNKERRIRDLYNRKDTTPDITINRSSINHSTSSVFKEEASLPDVGHRSPLEQWSEEMEQKPITREEFEEANPPSPTEELRRQRISDSKISGGLKDQLFEPEEEQIEPLEVFTVILTGEQYDHLQENDGLTFASFLQMDNGDVQLTFSKKEHQLDCIYSLLEQKKYPLTAFQKERYTDLTPEELQEEIVKEQQKAIQQHEKSFTDFTPTKLQDLSITAIKDGIQNAPISKKLLSKHFALLYEELKALNFQKLFILKEYHEKKTLTLHQLTGLINHIDASLRALRIERDEMKEQLELFRKQRKIDNHQELALKKCQGCQKVKWLSLSQIFCGKCTLEQRKQSKEGTI